MSIPALNSTEWRERAFKAEAELALLRAENEWLRAENAQNNHTIAAMEDVQSKLDAENNRL